MDSTAISSAILIFWAGFVCSISFMEAWIKFRVPGVTLSVGLSIGSRVFRAMNRMEWIFFLLLTGITVFSSGTIRVIFLAVLAIPAAILILQSFLFLPRLDQRAQRLIAGEKIRKSWLHLTYVVLETIKVIALIIMGLSVHAL